ncbi:MAG: 2TM domain-containing protein [Bacteroidota bacterium]
MENKDEQLWRIAKKRVNFKKQFASYIIINLFLWGIWWFTLEHNNYNYAGIPWPAWCSLGWGFGLAFSYYNAYHNNENAVTQEYQKLKDKERK